MGTKKSCNGKIIVLGHVGGVKKHANNMVYHPDGILPTQLGTQYKIPPITIVKRRIEKCQSMN